MNGVLAIPLIGIVIILTIIGYSFENYRREAKQVQYVQTYPAPASFHTIKSKNGKMSTFNRSLITCFYRDIEKNTFVINFAGLHALTITDVTEEEAESLRKGITREQ